MYNQANSSFHAYEYGPYPTHGQFQSHNITTSDEFRGFYSNGQQQGHRNEIDNGSRIMQNGFTGFESDPTTTMSATSFSRNELDFRGQQPESYTMVANKDVLQQQYGISQSKPKYPQYAVKSVRASTYRNFPPEVTQTPEDMAQAGFFYSGKDDVVYCYFCGQGIRAWEPEDDVWIEHARWSPNCGHLLNCKGSEFVRMVKLAETNPEMSYSSIENTREDLSTQVTTPMVNGQAVGGSSHKEENAKTLEDSDSPLLNTVAAQSVLLNDYSKESVIKAINVYKLKEDQRNFFVFLSSFLGRTDFSAANLLQIIFHMDEGLINYDELVSSAKLNDHKVSEPKLKNAHEQPVKNQQSLNTTEDKFARLVSFRHWPLRTAQTPEQMTESGFFYTGQDDLVQCYYCGVGMKNWEREDDPCIEHARWSPTCPYLLVNNGREFVQMVGEMDFDTNDSRIKENVDTGQVDGGSRKTKVCSLEDFTSQLLNTVAAKSVLMNDYSKDSVIKAINIYKLKEVESQRAKLLEEENRRLHEQTLCKICLEEQLAMVFLPCGHLVCCTKCAPALRKCPKCGGIITGSVKTSLI
ncbi:hypothetical protein KUTeg_006942 [Tegillarca granosa]|uniref:RING-type domain-containing protein n=1 Tax=Tegillarca granosa TaxID=220873 RepID=A0ABQ9FE64_TEGGR|nr:hypothetical protein KUTeg_006942 [Tegillarca granosa]